MESDDGETDFRESPGSSDTEAEEESKWAQGMKLYFFDDDVWVHYYQGGKAGAVGIWKKDGGASFVQNKSECTHLVINFVRTGVAERDRRASEDMCWAQNNGVGKLQRPIAAHACIAECLSLTAVCFCGTACVSTWWVTKCALAYGILDFNCANSFRPLETQDGAPEKEKQEVDTRVWVAICDTRV